MEIVANTVPMTAAEIESINFAAIPSGCKKVAYV